MVQEMKMKNPRIIIIGAGPCGLGAGWRLRELGYSNYTIYEQSDHVGGLASSYVDSNGFTWDVGGHVLHSHYTYFDQMFESVMRGDYFTHERESWVWIYDRFVPYPFQNNIRHLPKKAMDECLKGLYERSKKSPKHFADWIAASFGDGIANHFLTPYNKKVWAYPLDMMSFGWVGDRVATVDITRIEKNIREQKDDVSWGPNAVFHFPKRGGTGEIWRRVAKTLATHISYRKKVTRIDAKRHSIHFSDGTTDTYDELLSTMPLDVLLTRIGEQRKRKFDLHFSGVAIVGIGIKGEIPDRLRGKCWMYFPENQAPFFRATVFSHYSQFNAPPGSWSLMTEVSGSKERPFPQGDMIDVVIRGAKAVKLIGSHDTIQSTWAYYVDHGYPTPTINRDRFLHAVLQALTRVHVYSRGRFGAWKYEVSNQDHTFMQGVEWVNAILLGEKEITVDHANQVNQVRS